MDWRAPGLEKTYCAPHAQHTRSENFNTIPSQHKQREAAGQRCLLKGVKILGGPCKSACCASLLVVLDSRSEVLADRD